MSATPHENPSAVGSGRRIEKEGKVLNKIWGTYLPLRWSNVIAIGIWLLSAQPFVCEEASTLWNSRGKITRPYRMEGEVDRNKSPIHQNITIEVCQGQNVRGTIHHVSVF